MLEMSEMSGDQMVAGLKKMIPNVSAETEARIHKFVRWEILIPDIGGNRIIWAVSTGAPFGRYRGMP